MTQNIYDNPEFFAGYSNLARSRQGLDGAPEWPTLRGMLPDLNGRRVLDLRLRLVLPLGTRGRCGFGDRRRRLSEHARAGARRDARQGDHV